MKPSLRNSFKTALGVMSTWLCFGVITFAQNNTQPNPPPIGAGILATVEADQGVYTNVAPAIWCPPCVTNVPPCLLPCYYMEGQTAVAQFAFTIANNYNRPRTFEFSSGQQFDVELVDQTGQVVAAWSDGYRFTQALTSFTLGPGESQTLWAKMALNDRAGAQLNGMYIAHAFATTSGEQPRVEAATHVFVILAMPP